VRRAVAITDATVNPWAKALGLVEEGTPFSIWDIVPVWNRPDWDTKPEEDVMPTAPEKTVPEEQRQGSDGGEDALGGGFVDMRDPAFWGLDDGEWLDTPSSSTWRGVQNALGLTKGGLLSSLFGGGSSRFSTFTSPDAQAAIEAASKRMGLDPVEVKSEIAKALGFTGSNPPGVTSALFGPTDQWSTDWFNNVVNERKTIAGVVEKMALDKALNAVGLGTVDWGSAADRPYGIADMMEGWGKLGVDMSRLGDMNQLEKAVFENTNAQWLGTPQLGARQFASTPHLDSTAAAFALGQGLSPDVAGWQLSDVLGKLSLDNLTPEYVDTYAALKDLLTSGAYATTTRESLASLLGGGGLSGLVSANDLAAWERAREAMARGGGYGADERGRDYGDARDAESRSGNTQDDSYGKDEEGRGRGAGFS